MLRAEPLRIPEKGVFDSLPEAPTHESAVLDEEPAKGVPEAEVTIENLAGFEGEAGCFGGGGAPSFTVNENAAGVDGSGVVLQESAEGVKGRAAGVRGIESTD